MLSLTLITFIYDNNLILRSSLKDAYHMLQWAQKLNIEYTWYVDHYPTHLLLDPAMDSFLQNCTKQFITNKQEIIDIMHNIKPYTVCCISGHGTNKGLLYNTKNTLSWYKIYRALSAPYILLLIDCCHVALAFPWNYYNNKYINNIANIIYPEPSTYLLTACNNEGIARHNANGSYLINHFLHLHDKKIYKLEEWQKSFTIQYPAYQLHINSNVLLDNWLPLWLFYNYYLTIKNYLLCFSSVN